MKSTGLSLRVLKVIKKKFLSGDVLVGHAERVHRKMLENLQVPVHALGERKPIGTATTVKARIKRDAFALNYSGGFAVCS